MTKSLCAAFLATVALAGCVAAGNEINVVPQQPTPQQIVSARQASFHMSGAAMGNIKAAIDRGDEPARQAYAARGIARWARILPAMFPDSTNGLGPTRARPEIWANRADFEAKAAAYAAAATLLAETAQAGDRDAFAAQFRATAATCSACHDIYQVPQPAQR